LRPRLTRNSGDSGIDRRTQNVNSAGNAMASNITRQLCSGAGEIAVSPQAVRQAPGWAVRAEPPRIRGFAMAA